MLCCLTALNRLIVGTLQQLAATTNKLSCMYENNAKSSIRGRLKVEATGGTNRTVRGVPSTVHIQARGQESALNNTETFR